MTTWIVPLMLIGTAGLAGDAIAPGAAAPTVEAAADGDRPVLEYRHGGGLFKPYVAKFFSPAGVNVLRDLVPDHIHHHALMFAVAVDGVDFWSETPECGRQLDRSFGKAKPFPAGDPRAAVFESGIAWAARPDGPPLALEERKVTAYRRESLGASLLTWETRLRPPEGKTSIRVDGSHYFGLGMRFVESMDGADAFFTPKDPQAKGETVRGNERLLRGAWCAYTAEAEGKKVTVAMFDAPGNLRPAWWFVMAKPFAYLSATMNVYREPIAVESAKPLAVTYGVAVWDGKAAPEEIEKLYRRWLGLIGAKAHE